MRSAARYAVRDLVELEQEKCDLFEFATIDPLTKALNRRAFMRFTGENSIDSSATIPACRR